MLTDPCGILLIQPLVLVVLLWVFITLLLEFNNKICIQWMYKQITVPYPTITLPRAYTTTRYAISASLQYTKATASNYGNWDSKTVSNFIITADSNVKNQYMCIMTVGY